MLKKYLAALSLVLSLGFTGVALAEHDEKDPYEAMCQSTGAYSASVQALSITTTYAVQLYGHCGEQPNIIIMDEPQKLTDSTIALRHVVTVWGSPKKAAPYWKQLYKHYYYFDKQGNLVKSRRDNPDDTSFIAVVAELPSTLVVKRYCSAKKGAPIFPHAEGDLTCQRGVEDDSLLEKGYMDYLKDVKGTK